MKKLIIVGAGGHGRVVADVAKELGIYNEICFLDDNAASINGYEIIGGFSDIPKYPECDFFVAIGDCKLRKSLCEQIIALGFNLASPVSNHAVIGSNVEIGIGTVVMAGAVINNSAKIGSGVIINTCSSVDHDCIIGDYSHISVGAHLAGSVNVGENCFICAGATVINNINICENALIGAGAVVISDITEAGTYIGVPAKKK